jgi:hypothetical protein
MGFEIKARKKFERGKAQRGFTFDRREASQQKDSQNKAANV